eukprot:3174497-Pyramimonas_sp.AAC.1
MSRLCLAGELAQGRQPAARLALPAARALEVDAPSSRPQGGGERDRECGGGGGARPMAYLFGPRRAVYPLSLSVIGSRS